MKKKLSSLIFALFCAALFCACGEEEVVDTTYTDSSIVISSFTEIAGENPDYVEKTNECMIYHYEVKDPRVGAAAYNLYKDYLDANFTYSSLDSTAVGEGFCAVYYAANGETIEYTETVNKNGEYSITVSVPK